MMHRLTPLIFLALIAALVPASVLYAEEETPEPGVIRCANLTYGQNKSSVCFSDAFLKQAEEDTHIVTTQKFQSVTMESDELFDFPFSVMTGEGRFSLTDKQRDNLQRYLTAGGFVIASAGCSSKSWARSFRKEMTQVFPDQALVKLEADHPVFQMVYDVTSSRYKSGGAKLPHLEGLEIDDRIVLIFSPDGLNDTGNAGGNCCCCGGNEVKSAKKLNVNILAYALTY